MRTSVNFQFNRALAARVPFIATSGRGRVRRVELDMWPTDLDLPAHQAADAVRDITIRYASGRARWIAGAVYCVVERVPTANVPAVIQELRMLVETHGRPRRGAAVQ